jgi:hypothetical protein
VPQIWLTYDELAALMDCDPVTARGAAVAIGLDRRKCRDGYTRAKLTPSLTIAFLDRALSDHLQREIQASVDDLRAIHEQMASRLAAPLKISSAARG